MVAWDYKGQASAVTVTVVHSLSDAHHVLQPAVIDTVQGNLLHLSVQLKHRAPTIIWFHTAGHGFLNLHSPDWR
jgi:hypothetical protein